MEKHVYALHDLGTLAGHERSVEGIQGPSCCIDIHLVGKSYSSKAALRQAEGNCMSFDSNCSIRGGAR